MRGRKGDKRREKQTWMIAQESHYHTPDYNYCNFLRVMLWKHKAGFYSSIVFLLLCVTVEVFPVC